MANDISVSFSATETISASFAGAAGIPASTASNDFLLGNGTTFVKKTLAEIKTVLSLSGSNTGDQDLSGLVASTDIDNIVQITAAAYAALSPPVSTTLYIIIG